MKPSLLQLIALATFSFCLFPAAVAGFGSGDEAERPTNGSDVVVTVDDLRRLGLPKLNKTCRDYYQSGADQEQTLHENTAAFKRWRLLYRVLVDVLSRSTRTTMLGQEVSMPLGIAPSAMQKMAHRDGEKGTAVASQDAGTVMILSTLSSTSIEDLRAAAPNATLWLQLYVFKNRTVTEELLHRAYCANFSAVVLTVDAPTWGQRIVDVRNAFTIPEGITLGNFDRSVYSNFDMTNATSGSGLTRYTNDFFDQSLTWKDVLWLKNVTSLPVVLKGIMSPEDAQLAVHYGVQAIIVSNHGGRQLDGVPSTRRFNEYRPAFQGTDGVRKMLDIFLTEINRTLALMGHSSVHTFKPQDLIRQERYGLL
ncbi:hypothetical protein V5799_026640 [Amblyomma americanum]|uniref:FMN hydroxy acid dehydrogenase domain-containing protein n=1 Tax=Amblyomma americanum TaxID=6943 RepID=A0AAQ4DI02_AMBAM